jgi:hypothetical protein
MSRHFEVPRFPRQNEVFFYVTEIVDLMFTLSVIKHDRITEDMVAEAKKAGKAYLRIYLPEELPKRTVR